eukprot:m.141349 g.141349  ORF g.141349 m.141349 type:complete len:337 (+) comp14847_c0_seq1:173-1183(+)
MKNKSKKGRKRRRPYVPISERNLAKSNTLTAEESDNNDKSNASSKTVTQSITKTDSQKNVLKAEENNKNSAETPKLQDNVNQSKSKQGRKRRRPYVPISERNLSQSDAASKPLTPENGTNTDKSLKTSTPAENDNDGKSSSKTLIPEENGSHVSTVQQKVSQSGRKKKRKKKLKELQPGDELQIKTFRDTTMNVVVRVQPNPKGYGGMGYARPSAWLDIRSKDFDEKFLSLFLEHVEGMTGKSFKKARKKEMGATMLWRQRVAAKLQNQSNTNQSVAAKLQNQDNNTNPTTSRENKQKSVKKKKQNTVDEAARLQAIKMYRRFEFVYFKCVFCLCE